jgi:hypothetical protein
MMPPAPTRILGPLRHVGNEHGGGRAGDAGHAVVLGQPEAAVAPPFGMLGQGQRVAEGLDGIGALRDGGEVEDGKRDHCS